MALCLSLVADLYVEKMRFEAVKCMARSYRPTIPVSFLARTLGFTGTVGAEGETDGLEDCEEWLRCHGSHLQYESGSNELVMDAKVNPIYLRLYCKATLHECFHKIDW